MSEAAAAPQAAPAGEAAEAPALPENMTGAEAKAWVEAQKAQKTSPAKAGAEKKSEADPVREAAKEASRKLKFQNDDGSEEEVDEEEVLKTYRNRKGHQREANRILQEGKVARQQAEEFVKLLKDPKSFWDIAKKIGHDPRALSEAHLGEVLTEEMMDPKERELKQVKTELQRLKEIDDAAKAEAKAKVDAALKAKYAKDYTEQFTTALKESGLPPTKPMVGEMAKYIFRASKLGYAMTASEAATLVKEDVQTAYQNLYGNADADVLTRLIGDEGMAKIRKADVARLRNPAEHLRTPQEQGPVRERRSTEGERPTKRTWREYNLR